MKSQILVEPEKGIFVIATIEKVNKKTIHYAANYINAKGQNCYKCIIIKKGA